MTALSESIIPVFNKSDSFKKVLSSYNNKLIKEKINKYELNISGYEDSKKEEDSEQICHTKLTESFCHENYLFYENKIKNDFRKKINKTTTDYLRYRMKNSN